MSYIKRKGYGLMGFGDASSCGTNQQWDANCFYAGVQGQCVPTGMVGKASGCDYTKTATTSSGSIWDSLIKGITEIGKAKVTAAPVTNISTTTTGGMSTTTKVALVGAGVLALAVVYKATRK